MLLDDYYGSGATMKEAVRALRSALDEKTADRTEIVPFTIAKVRWRLGAAGMI
jgi:predicted amidophosphoribosyltransferase